MSFPLMVEFGTILQVNSVKANTVLLPSSVETNDTAILSSAKDYTLFSYGGREIKFRAPRSLRRYLRINKWDFGYIAVETEYDDCTEEEYIDLNPILRDLCIEPMLFLAPIRNVEVKYV